MKIGAATVKTKWRFLKKLKLLYDPAIPLLDIYPEKKITNLKRYTNPYVHSSTIYNRQHMQATQLPISRQMDKEDVVHVNTDTHTHTHTHNGILLSLEKEWNFATYSNMVGPREY